MTINSRKPLRKDKKLIEDNQNKQVRQNSHKSNKYDKEENIENEQLDEVPEENHPSEEKTQAFFQISDVYKKTFIFIKTSIKSVLQSDASSSIISKSKSWVKKLNPSIGPLPILSAAVLVIILSMLVMKPDIINYFFKKDISFDVKVHNQTQDEIDFDDELYGLEEVYINQEEKVWYTLASGIKSVKKENPTMPSVFLLIFDSDEAGETAKCLTEDVTKAATKYIMEREIQPLMITGAELNKPDLVDDPGRLLVKYKEEIKNKLVMIVTNLQDVQAKVATSFHFFCDRFSPHVAKAVYFFTFKLKKIPEGHLQKAAENELLNLWSHDMPDNKLHPLITRLTGNVLRIVNDRSKC